MMGQHFIIITLSGKEEFFILIEFSQSSPTWIYYLFCQKEFFFLIPTQHTDISCSSTRIIHIDSLPSSQVPTTVTPPKYYYIQYIPFIHDILQHKNILLSKQSHSALQAPKKLIPIFQQKHALHTKLTLCVCVIFLILPF
jgi:hypothetical protein